MENQLNDGLNPQEDVSSKSDLVGQIDTTSLPKASGFSSFVQDVKNNKGKDIKTGISDIPPVRTEEPVEEPKPAATNNNDNPLQNIGKFVQGQVETGKEEIFPTDYESYAPYFNNLGYYTPRSKEALDTQRAHEQGKVEEFTRAASRVALKVPF